MKPKHADDGAMCPLWRKACVKVCHACEMWDHIMGKHPQTGADVDQWACTFKMQTYLSIENTMVARQTTASVDNLRKEVSEVNGAAMSLALQNINNRVLQLGSETPRKMLEN